MKTKAIIIDDEIKLRDVLKIKLNQHCPEIEVIAEASNANEAENLINKLNPQLVFLDIKMPGDSGFDLLSRFPEILFEIIFVTGFNEFALKALKVSAVDYILKPVQNEDLLEAVKKATDRIKEKKKLHRYEILKHNIEKGDTNEAKIVIPGAKYYQYVSVDKIMHCEGWQKYTRIHLESDEVITSSYNIGIFRDLLESYNFFSPHKSHLINMNKVDRYSKEGSIILTNGNEVPVSRRRKSDFLEAMKG